MRISIGDLLLVPDDVLFVKMIVCVITEKYICKGMSNDVELSHPIFLSVKAVSLIYIPIKSIKSTRFNLSQVFFQAL